MGNRSWIAVLPFLCSAWENLELSYDFAFVRCVVGSVEATAFEQPVAGSFNGIVFGC